jgi:plastocyanin
VRTDYCYEWVVKAHRPVHEDRALSTVRGRLTAQHFAGRHRVAVLIAVASTVVAAGCAGNQQATPPPPGPPAAGHPAAVHSVPAVTVVISNFTYMPRYFTVPPGATVMVRNGDQVVHTLTADNGEFNTGNVTQGLPTTFQAPTQPGRYAFHCFHHPYMTGALTVS